MVVLEAVAVPAAPAEPPAAVPLPVAVPPAPPAAPDTPTEFDFAPPALPAIPAAFTTPPILQQQKQELF